jgi:hypothetical protein
MMWGGDVNRRRPQGFDAVQHLISVLWNTLPVDLKGMGERGKGKELKIAETKWIVEN